jgi:small subunit ribosomal protein S14
MARKALIERNKKKRKVVARYAEKRAELKANHDYEELNKLPRNASPSRVVNRCNITGRRHAYFRKFGVSRLTFRELALSGMIPGVTKASW